MKRALLLLTLGTLGVFGQMPVGGSSGGGGGSGLAATNPTATSAPAVTTLPITVTSLNLTSINPAVLQCWSGTTTRTPLAITNFTTTGTNPITTVTPTFSSTANVTCQVNATGGAGATGQTGPTGATGAAGTPGTNGTNGTNGMDGTNGAISQIQDEGSNLTVRPTLNCVGAGIACTDDAGNSRTLITVTSGGSGASSISQLTDFQVVKTSGTVETMNGACSATAPCNLYVGSTTYTFTTSATATISGTSSTGNVYWCLSSTGSLLLFHNLMATITGSGITVTSGFGSCAAGSPGSRTLWVTTMTANVWDAMAESMDKRALLGFKPSLTGGTGITVTPGDIDSVAIDAATVPTLGGANAYTGTEDSRNASASFPDVNAASAPGTCTVGQMYFNTASLHTYRCTTTNTWTQVDGGGGSTPPTGGAYFVWGAPWTTGNTALVGVSPAGTSHGGSVWSFIAQTPTVTALNYRLTTGGAAGTGIIFGIFSANLATNICSAVASGTDATAAGAKTITISGCSLTVGGAYRLVVSTDSTALQVLGYGEGYSYTPLNVTTATMAAYDAGSNISTGTGSGLAFATLTGITWTAFSDNGDPHRPVIVFGN